MAAEERLRSKALYKITLLALKVMPMLLALVALLNSTLSYTGLDITVLSYIGGISLLPLAFLYLVSYVFCFCPCHRMFLHYVAVTDCINIYDYHIGIPLDDLQMLCLYAIVTGTCLFITLYLYAAHHKRPAVRDSRQH